MSVDLVDFVNKQADKAFPNPELDPFAVPLEELNWKFACKDEEEKRQAYIKGAMMILKKYNINTLPKE